MILYPEISQLGKSPQLEASLLPAQCPILCLVTQSCPTLCNSMDCSPPGSSVHGNSPGKNTGVGCHALLQGIFPTQGIKPRSPALQKADSLPSEPPGKPKNTGVSSLSLLQGTFLTQELNQGLLHCRRILYQLSHQKSPKRILLISNMRVSEDPLE